MLLAVSLLYLWRLSAVAPEEACQFPRFMQSPMKGGVLQPWTTKTWWLFLRHRPKWAEKNQIIVENGHIWRTRYRNKQKCQRSRRRLFQKPSHQQCPIKEEVHNRTCMSEEGENTYRVIQYLPDGTHRFTCMKFKNESNSVVQVYQGRLMETNDPNLCDKDSLSLEEWPWIANWNQESKPCNISGGFSFRTIRRLTNEDFCEEEWRRSTLEMECMKGDGMEFITPANGNCNPFSKHSDVKRLSCWAGWQTENFTFIIASDAASKEPRYCLRFPKNLDGEFSVLVYFSVICPTQQDGKPITGIEYYELRMHRKEPLKCEDDDQKKCKELFKSPDDCAKKKAYAPHCPFTCERCPLMTREEIMSKSCQFDDQILANWKYYTKRHYEDQTVTVNITPDKAIFSHLGHFQCMDRDKHRRKYKVASLYNNGCVPRYTCLEFRTRGNNALQYKISPSERSELPMEDLCTFRDDPAPLKDYIRSYHFRNLIKEKDLFMASYCGFDGKIPFNGTVNGRSCRGTISAWSETLCLAQGILTLSSDTCKELVLPLEFQCLSHIQEEEVKLQQLLLTRSLDGTNTYNCWILTSYMNIDRLPMRILYQLPTAQCTLVSDIDLSDTRSDAVLYLDDRKMTKECYPSEAKPPALPNNDASNAGYAVSNTNNPVKDPSTIVEVESDQSNDSSGESSPITDTHHTDPPYGGLQRNNANSNVWSVSSLLLITVIVITGAFPHLSEDR